ncbi:hypothetical protein I4U23_012046 [Adineta vaga]|nr:hypothetical protein I4U23_012046 [Adineta vaga]
MVHDPFEYLCIVNRYEYNAIIDLMQSQIDKNKTACSNYLENIDSLSSCVVEMSESEDESDKKSEVSFDSIEQIVSCFEIHLPVIVAKLMT